MYEGGICRLCRYYFSRYSAFPAADAPIVLPSAKIVFFPYPPTDSPSHGY